MTSKAPTLILYRMGDYYYLFRQDAAIASQVLTLPLTQRDGMPACGIPRHCLEAWCGLLEDDGYRVVCLGGKSS